MAGEFGEGAAAESRPRSVEVAGHGSAGRRGDLVGKRLPANVHHVGAPISERTAIGRRGARCARHPARDRPTMLGLALLHFGIRVGNRREE